MKKTIHFLIIVSFSVIILLGNITAQNNTQDLLPLKNTKDNFETFPLLFTENLGQVTDQLGQPNNDVLFTAHHRDIKIFLSGKSISYQFERNNYNKDKESNTSESTSNCKAFCKSVQKESFRFTLSLQGANSSPKFRKEMPSDYTENFYLPHCPNGITGVHTFGKVVLENVYPGIDWVIYSSKKDRNSAGLEYDFVVHPGADPSLIKLKVTDSKGVHLNAKGELQIATSLGTVKENAPVSYCNKKVVPTTFNQLANGDIIFKVAKWDRTKTLIIDPSVSWSTYYGGPNNEDSRSVSTDAAGNVYICGRTLSTSGIANGGYQNTFGGGFDADAMLVKFSSTGSRLWATYFGGSGDDAASSCKTDASGNVYMAGGTTSGTGMALNGFQNTYSGNGDGFLAKFSSTGSLLWSTYYGGSGNDGGNACTVDGLGNVYLTGNTGSSTGIASGGFQNTISGSSSAYLVKFNSSGNRLWGTYYGGNVGSSVTSCAVDNSNNIFLAGITSSSSGIASGGFQNTLAGISDAFAVKFDNSGNRQWATYMGGEGTETASSCATDLQGNIYLAGYTNSLSGISFNGHQNTYGGSASDAFLVKLTSNGGREWATYLGGNGGDYAYTCAIDAYGNSYIGGYTGSTDNIASGGFQNTYLNGADAFLVKFNNNGVRQWGTYYGGSLSDIGYGCTIDAANNIYLTGNTSSTTGISTNGFQNTLAGANDAFVVKIGDEVLSIKLLNFFVLKNGSINTLHWQTSLETTGTRFYIERSDDGINFKPISDIINGRSTNGSSYAFNDLNPHLPTNYYRLKMVEASAAVTYSAIVAVRNGVSTTSTVSPNPAKSGIVISNKNASLIGTTATITDMNGKEVFKFTVSATSFIGVQSWISGIYNVRYSDGSIIRFIKD